MRDLRAMVVTFDHTVRWQVTGCGCFSRSRSAFLIRVSAHRSQYGPNDSLREPRSVPVAFFPHRQAPRASNHRAVSVMSILLFTFGHLA